MHRNKTELFQCEEVWHKNMMTIIVARQIFKFRNH